MQDEQPSDELTSSQPARKRRRVNRYLLAVLLILAVGLGGIVVANPDYFSHGAWTGRFDRPGLPSPVVERGEKILLLSGNRIDRAFDIRNSHLNQKNLRKNLGRETIPAIYDPKFVSADEAEVWLARGDQVIVVYGEDVTYVYPLRLLVSHEAVNDVVDGVPILVAFCVQAALGAVYEREILGRVHTFGLSGHLYYERGTWDARLAFLLWDRETESLWWPPKGKAVSGLMRDAPLPLLDRDRWSQTKWEEIRDLDTEIRVLAQRQSAAPPENLPIYTSGPDAAPLHRADIAPRWGDNAAIPD